MISSCILTSILPSLSSLPFYYSLCSWCSCLDDILYLDPFSSSDYTRETPDFGGISLALSGSGAFGGGKRKKIGAPAAPPNCFKNFHWAMKIPNMCLVLKLDNGKVVSKFL